MNLSPEVDGVRLADSDELPPPRVVVVTTPRHGYTTRKLEATLVERGMRMERRSYGDLFRATELPRTIYVLTDFDRMHPWALELAGRFRARLVDGGATVLNDPRAFVPRSALLRRLRCEGINDFTCWLPVEGEWPERYPVFLRTIAAHRGVESDLLRDRAAAARALDAALAAGRVLSDLAFVEYRAAPQPETGVFRKHACYGVAGRIVRALTVTDAHWMAKIGTVGAAWLDDYRRDLAEHRDYPHADLMRRVFRLAGLDYGRIDFGMVDGRPQIYEVNSNPTIGWTREHPSAMRLEADRISREALVAAFEALPAPTPGSVDVSDLLPEKIRRRPEMWQP